jgi:hypothetical protein
MRTDVQTDGHTDMKKLIVALRNFLKAPKDYIHFEGACCPVPFYRTPFIHSFIRLQNDNKHRRSLHLSSTFPLCTNNQYINTLRVYRPTQLYFQRRYFATCFGQSCGHLQASAWGWVMLHLNIQCYDYYTVNP